MICIICAISTIRDMYKLVHMHNISRAVEQDPKCLDHDLSEVWKVKL